jgi:N-acylneuraminate cytidylyltransferase
MNNRILCIIPARGGSKGLADKNIRKLGNKPLLSWTLDAALDCKYELTIILSSDSKRILNITENKRVIKDKRPIHLASDDATSEQVIEYLVNEYDQAAEYDYLLLLQPTSPFRNSDHINKAIEMCNKDSAINGVISVYEIDNKCLKAFVLDQNNYLSGIRNNKYPFATRQSLPKVYMSNGAIYIIKRSAFIETKCLFDAKIAPMVMTENESLDIDSESDLKRAEQLLNTY